MIIKHLLLALSMLLIFMQSLCLAQGGAGGQPHNFDLVITDMTMPYLTGDKLATELMKIRPDIPVMLCTGYSKKISAESAAAIGIKAIAYKPMVKADLAQTVRKVLDEAKAKHG